MTSNKLPWLEWAKNEIGVRRLGSTPGNPRIIEYWKLFKMGGIKEEKTSWCSALVGAALESSGISTSSPQDVYKIRTKDSSQYWLHWVGGEKLHKPAYGCIGVMTRTGGGHVGFVVGETEMGDIIMLGGNQGSAVSIARFPRSAFVGFVMPRGYEPDYSIPRGEAAVENRLE